MARDRRAAINLKRSPFSLHLILPNFSIRAFVLWHSDKIALKLRLPLSFYKRVSSWAPVQGDDERARGRRASVLVLWRAGVGTRAGAGRAEGDAASL